MGILVACLTTGKGTWNTVTEIINSTEWKKIYLITNDFGKENYKHKKEINYVIINLADNVEIMRDKIIAGLEDLQKEIGFSDVALNFSSGIGKEHSAMLAAILKLGCGIRIVDTKNKELITI
jgi:hypothetical protein